MESDSITDREPILSQRDERWRCAENAWSARQYRSDRLRCWIRL